MTHIEFKDLPRIEQIRWIDKVQELIDRNGLSLFDEPIEAAAKRLYESLLLSKTVI